MNKIPTQPKTCIVCKIVFERESGYGLSLWSTRKTCSITCRTIRQRKEKIGFQKGHKWHKNSYVFPKGNIPWNKGDKGRKPWMNTSGLMPGQNKGKKTSDATRAKIRTARAKQDMSGRAGKNHWNWKGGTSPLRARVQQTQLYREWRSSIFKRDDYICQFCYKRGGKIHADHIKPYSVIISENNITTVEQAKKCTELWDISNGRTLCVPCHQKTDTYGSKSISKH